MQRGPQVSFECVSGSSSAMREVNTGQRLTGQRIATAQHVRLPDSSTRKDTIDSCWDYDSVGLAAASTQSGLGVAEQATAAHSGLHLQEAPAHCSSRTIMIRCVSAGKRAVHALVLRYVTSSVAQHGRRLYQYWTAGTSESRWKQSAFLVQIALRLCALVFENRGWLSSLCR